jgi:tetratricopeptide (TPR) repeat protein
VGRDAELATLATLLERAVGYHAPQVLLVVGSAGTGKTRLISDWAAGVGAPVRVLAGATVAELLARRLGLGGASEEDDHAAVRAAVAEVFGDDPAGDLAGLLASMIGLQPSLSPLTAALGEAPAELAAAARAVLRRFLDRDAARAPLVLVLDDLDRASDAELDLVGELAVGLAGVPVLLALVGRSELLVRRPRLAQGAGDLTRLELGNLPVEQASALLRQRLAPAGRVPRGLIEDAVAMTGGNPGLLGAWLQALVDDQALDVSVTPWRLDPARAAATELAISVEQAIDARISALTPDERDVLERAAVFGNVFWVSGLVAMARLERRAAGAKATPSFHDEAEKTALLATLDRLAERDYVLRLPVEDSSIPGDVEVVFKHNLERELIASRQDGERRRRLYRIAAQWVEVKLAERSEEQLELIAQLHEGGGDGRRAALALLAAGNKARGRFANTAALELYARALALLDADDVLPRLDALHGLGGVLSHVGRGDEAAARFQEMLELAWLFDHPAKAGAALGRIGRIHRQRGEYEQALDCFNEARGLFERAQDRRGIAAILDDVGTVHWMRGLYPAALDHHREALAIRRTVGDKRSIALSMANIGRVQLDSGVFNAALERFREALELRRGVGDRVGVATSMVDLAMVHEASGKHEAAREILAEALKLARETGDRQAQAQVLAKSGEVLLALGQTDAAREALEKASEAVVTLGDRLGQAECARVLAEVALARGDTAAAPELARRALELAERLGSRGHVGVARRVLAQVLAAGAAVGDGQGPGELFEGAIKVLAGVSNDLELARCYRAYAKYREGAGDAAEAARLRQRADDIFARLRGAAAGPA